MKNALAVSSAARLSLFEGEKMKKKKALYLLTLAVGICFIVYYLACGIAIGFTEADVWIWAAGGAVLIAASLLLLRRLKKGVLRRTGKAYTLLRVCGWCVLCCALALFVLVETLVISHMSDQEPEGLDCIVVLGAGVNGTMPSNALEYRINKAAEYMQANPDTVCVATGGKQEGDEITEAECIRAELVKRKIDGSRVIVENTSTSTWENISNAYALLPDGIETVGIVTNNFHVYRSVKVAGKVGGYKVYGINAGYSSMLIIHYTVREFFTVCVYCLTGLI